MGLPALPALGNIAIAFLNQLVENSIALVS